ncbi:transcriptional repressor [Podochytrium sp. JEL0797]|nr:transcriptional repressor [Podochytrium sp. JEL0797]
MSPTSSTDAPAIEMVRKRYPCKSCDKDFSTSGQLSRHNRIHKGVKRFQCDVPGCERTFFRADNREQHSRSHKRRLEKQHERAADVMFGVGRLQQNSTEPPTISGLCLSNPKNISIINTLRVP